MVLRANIIFTYEETSSPLNARTTTCSCRSITRFLRKIDSIAPTYPYFKRLSDISTPKQTSYTNLIIYTILPNLL
jgi:hypothetical protein